MRVFLGNVAISQDAEYDGWHISEMFFEIMGDRLRWFEENYPDLPIMRATLKDPSSYQNIYKWYVDFPDTESLVHYKLTYGYEKTDDIP